MAKSSDNTLRCCNVCGIELTNETQSSALAKHRRKLCTKCGSRRSASYAPRYTEARSASQKARRAELAKRRKLPTPAERLMSKIAPRGQDECWEWVGTISKATGYGMFRLNGTTITASRAVLEVIAGIDMRGLVARHKCDNRGCVNPRHLEPGSHQDNSNDMVSRGRGCFGQKRVDAALSATRVARRKLTESQAADGYRRALAGEDIGAIARELGVTKDSIRNIVSGNTWSHVTGLKCGRHTWASTSNKELQHGIGQ